MLLAVNILFIPQYGYWACAWGGVAGYGTAMVLSYFIGQKKNPIPYPMKDIARYVALAAALTAVMLWWKGRYPVWLELVGNTWVIIFFVADIVNRDMPLSGLPVIGKYFKKK